MPLENQPRLLPTTLSKRNRAVMKDPSAMLVFCLEASWNLCGTASNHFGAALKDCRIIGFKHPTAGSAVESEVGVDPSQPGEKKLRIVSQRLRFLSADLYALVNSITGHGFCASSN
ncbi:unnamed protein product [Parnassius apollo]|uniref:(apollo) hypothetical protein n=1 Tax=Parnassius apollo TaxID=110799 RepID=A0A8S3W6P7_PARAO|nr:unnamed protein product [Parnassius apollo]